ncbi:MAG: ABC transporter ATP-binding protein [Elusimicrobia bacterium]|nr:ABC transporter ATP-binding protein [Elusimicrobiota bacterium]
MASIELKGVRKEFGGRPVLAAIELSIAEGEFFTLVGPSGSGKSTLLNVLAGLDVPTAGRVLFDGIEVQGLGPAERDVAMVFQSYALYPHKRVRDNLAFPLLVKGLPAEERGRKVAEVARMLGIEDLLDRRPSQLSGGQQQRVALGRALIRSPKVFLLDEPLSNLDAKLRNAMRLELRRLHQAAPVTTVYVTHDQEEAMSLSDRLAVLHGGALQQVGTPAEVYDRPANLFVAQFIGKPEMNAFEATLEGGRLRVGASLLEVPGGAALGGLEGRAVLVGIRPEHVEAGASVGAEARVEVVEPLGAESWVELRWEDRPMLLKTADRSLRPGQRTRLRLPSERLHLFDAATRGRLG